MSSEAYRDLVSYTAGIDQSARSRTVVEKLGDRLGFDLSVWQKRMGLPGLFQSTAVGLPESRERFAKQAGKKWIADTTQIWL